MKSPNTYQHEQKQLQKRQVSIIQQQQCTKIVNCQKKGQDKNINSIRSILQQKIMVIKQKKDQLQNSQIQFTEVNKVNCPPNKNRKIPLKQLTENTQIGNKQVQKQKKLQQQKVVVLITELQKFTRSFAIQKIEYEENLTALRLELKEKQKNLCILEAKLQQAIQDQHRMINVMQGLKMKHQNQIDEFLQAAQRKDETINALGSEIKKLNLWMSQQREQNRKLLQIIKIKKQSESSYGIEKPNLCLVPTQNFHFEYIISQADEKSFMQTNKINDDRELFKLYSQANEEKSVKKSPGKSKKIIIKKAHKCDSNKQKKSTIESNFSTFNTDFNQKIRELVSALRDRDIEIERLRKKNEELKRSREEQNMNGLEFKSIQNERQKILVNKCLCLEIQIEKLMQKLFNAGKQKNFLTSEISVKMDSSRQLRTNNQKDEQKQLIKIREEYNYIFNNDREEIMDQDELDVSIY